ncbi:Asp-tRNA(Asn)/Glu-tRNA(Gln) amidotransferase A subunit family amidase [Marinoscillum furvescens DSM 4134]|uniref:Asp-tRNA(Asn)/Glu-tRNA(Gln) amidotransferase A subunit family amidase n=1 Tax=Marinoscillum furvescens DSM 4134 TaxID=1122208 RepID=A0A3D9L6U9_MARFU|nr:Asp-tRNA(Asn)/Glu-tRNA(Gln) amidotransferase A subunit family amidase [Marinoscillum furvescens DSM 4134]
MAMVLAAAHVHAQQDSIQSALRLFGLQMTTSEIDSLRGSLADNLESYEQIRSLDISNSTPFSLVFTPPVNEAKVPQEQMPVDFALPKKVKRPKDLNDLAFYTVADLSVLIRERKVTSVELTELYISRLKKYDEQLECVVTLTEELALGQARRADVELAAGKYRGPLHGIPYGAKDLLAVEGYPTTWGGAPYQDQVIDETATVIRKLEEAGAVLVAKLSLGALAWGDVWFGGVTKNPWNLEQGSSGSSAGSASATAAGLVPFAIGSETWGSIVSPSTRCGTSGLRPTHGRVSKYGAMALSWTMDKLGPITRSAQDLAMVFDAIYGPDGKDIEVRRDVPFNYVYDEEKAKKLRVGYLKSFETNDFNPKNDSTALSTLRASGVELIEKELKTGVPPYALSFILSAEAAAAFDDLTRSNLDDDLTRQIINSWPNVFRSARFIPAVEYIQANRLRYQLVQDFNAMMADVDVLIAPSFSDQLLITNLTGHPCVVVPNGSYAGGTPGSITFLGNHFDEESVLLFARYFQSITDFDEEHPELFVK